MITAAHPRYVLDASVAVKWFTQHQEPYREKALALRNLHRAGRCRLALPEFAFLEILNAVRYSARASEEDGKVALASLNELQLDIERVGTDVIERANATAWRYDLALYDAAYIALAECIGFPLLTADEDLLRRVRGHGMVLGLDELVIPA